MVSKNCNVDLIDVDFIHLYCEIYLGSKADTFQPQESL